ncbi:alpha/beta fold hydrolase [Prauserella cavernicola]|uniref:Alpha/beta hydrolase n=1 Tax=Prauserella cavernicola TaxID=2800127 RepID=A0A934V3Q9_9PSEU|nr:alpha/beta hydrolase [Prauserella cavernicola]MBK1787541.1 alpha/beta hydrolase [Prauserella cavernicola]
MTTPHSGRSSADDTARAPLGEHYDVSGAAMLLHRCGTGGPPVVFLAGGGMFGLYYWNVHTLVAEFTTSVVYDRLGTGWSDPVDLPRSGTRVTDDLRELLRAAAVPDPYVLVGHSLGGLYARLYAKRFPGEIAGLVLLDPTHEDIVGYLPEERARLLRDTGTDERFSPEQLDAMRTAYRATFGRALADWPAEIREPVLDQGFSRETYRRSLREPMNLPRLFGEVRDAGPDPDVPTIIVSAMGTDTVAEELVPPEARASLAESAQTKHRLYTDLAATLPRTTVRRVDDAGHSGIAWRRPDAVVRAIRDIPSH